MNFSSLAERFDFIWRMAVLYAFMALLLVLSIISLSYPSLGVVNVPFFLMVVYYWGIYRPSLLPMWLVFICGALVDLMGAAPLGLNILLFLVLKWTVVDQRRFLMSQSFFVLWFGFSVFTAAYNFLRLCVFFAMHLTFAFPEGFWAAILINIGIFPVIYSLLNLTHKLLPSREVQGRFRF